jgi:hypothetical protein
MMVEYFIIFIPWEPCILFGRFSGPFAISFQPLKALPSSDSGMSASTTSRQHLGTIEEYATCT